MSGVSGAGPYVHRGPVPLVQVEGAHLGHVHPHTAVGAGALDAEHDAQVEAGPLHHWGRVRGGAEEI